MYCVLIGTMLFDFESEEDAAASISPKNVIEVLNVGEWDGHGRVNTYQNGFLIVSIGCVTHYVCAPSAQERDDWVLHIKYVRECVFVNKAVAPFKPSKILSTRPSLIPAKRCCKTKTILTPSNMVFCTCCGRSFCSNEYISESSCILQIGCEES